MIRFPARAVAEKDTNAAASSLADPIEVAATNGANDILVERNDDADDRRWPKHEIGYEDYFIYPDQNIGHSYAPSLFATWFVRFVCNSLKMVNPRYTVYPSAAPSIARVTLACSQTSAGRASRDIG